MKKILSLTIICALLATLLCGCGGNGNGNINGLNPDPFGTVNGNNQVVQEQQQQTLSEQALVGKWQVAADVKALTSSVSDMGEAIPALQMLQMMGSAQIRPITFMVEFTADGKLEVDMSSMIPALTNLIQDLISWMKQGENFYTLYAMMTGMNVDQLKATLQQQGQNPQMILSMLEQQFATYPQQLQQALSTTKIPTTYYKLEGNRLYTWGEDGTTEECMTIEYYGNRIVVTSFTGDGAVMNFENGAYTFTRQ